MRGEEIGNDVVVFNVAERAGRVYEQAAWAYVACVAGEDFALALGGGCDVSLNGGPFELRETPPRASTAARCVDENPIVESIGRGRMLAYGDLRQARPVGAEL